MVKGLQKEFLMLGVIFGLVFLTGQATAASVYDFDKAHSKLEFSVKHLMVSNVKGEFTDYEGTINFDPDNLADSRVDVVIQAKSVDTRIEARDKHLKGPEFLDTDKFQTIAFKSAKILKSGDIYNIVGDLTIHGVTQEIEIPVTISGPVNSPMGGTVIGISGETTINRQKFGVAFSKTMDNGGLLVDDFVKIIVNVEGHLQQPPQPVK